MRTGIKPMYTGVQEILSAFDSLRVNVPYFSIWYGKDLLYQFNSEDLEQGREALQNILLAAEQSDNSDVLLIKFHPRLKSGYVTNTSEVVGTLPVRVVALEDGISSITGLNAQSGMSMPNSGYYFLKEATAALGEIKQGNLNIEQRLIALESGSDKEPDWFDKISGILEKPGMPDLIGQLLSRFIPAPAQNNIVMSGVPRGEKVEEKKELARVDVTATIANNNQTEAVDMEYTQEEDAIINTCINRLSEHCDVVKSLALLADYADANPLMFKTILGGLKV